MFAFIRCLDEHRAKVNKLAWQETLQDFKSSQKLLQRSNKEGRDDCNKYLAWDRRNVEAKYKLEELKAMILNILAYA